MLTDVSFKVEVVEGLWELDIQKIRTSRLLKINNSKIERLVVTSIVKFVIIG